MLGGILFRGRLSRLGTAPGSGNHQAGSQHERQTDFNQVADHGWNSYPKKCVFSIQ